MADRIKVSAELLNQIAREVENIQDIVMDADRILSGVRLTQESGGRLELRMNRSLPGGIRITGDNAEEVLRSLERAMRKAGDQIGDIARGVSRSAELFDDAEKKNGAMFEEGGSVHGMEYGQGGGNSASFSSYHGDFDDAAWNLQEWIKKILEQFKRKDTPKQEEPKPAQKADPFDSIGKYGGNQSDVRSDYEDHAKYKAIIERNTGHRFANDNELKIYLKRMESEGCGYMAMCNTIFAAFKNRPDEFKKRFGFDMYDGDDLNYNELFVDIYSSWDNKSKNGKFDANRDYNKKTDGAKSNYNYWSDGSGAGTNISWRRDIMEEYLKDHGVKADGKVYDGKVLTADKYNELVKSGKVEKGMLQIRMSGKPAYLYDANGKVAAQYSGGHAMTVTGTTGSGKNAMLIVSSWGRQYYVKPEAFCAKNNLGVNTGSFGYMYMDIDV